MDISRYDVCEVMYKGHLRKRELLRLEQISFIYDEKKRKEVELYIFSNFFKPNEILKFTAGEFLVVRFYKYHI